jgi:hypothetical protein
VKDRLILAPGVRQQLDFVDTLVRQPFKEHWKCRVLDIASVSVIVGRRTPDLFCQLVSILLALGQEVSSTDARTQPRTNACQS